MGVLLSFSDRKEPSRPSGKRLASKAAVVAHPSAGLRDIETLMLYVREADEMRGRRR